MEAFDKLADRVLDFSIVAAYNFAPLACVPVGIACYLAVLFVLLVVGTAVASVYPLLIATLLCVMVAHFFIVNVAIIPYSGEEDFGLFCILAVTLPFLPIYYTYAALGAFATLVVLALRKVYKGQRTHTLDYDKEDKVAQLICGDLQQLMDTYDPPLSLLFEYGGNVATFVGNAIRRFKNPKVVYRREDYQFPDYPSGQKGGACSIDWLDRYEGKREAPDNRPDVDSEYNRSYTGTILFIVHGNGEGGPNTDMELHTAWYYKEKTDWKLGFIIHRGCGTPKSPLDTPCGVNPCNTDDVKYCLELMRRRFPKATFLGIGMSMGALLVGKYVGEAGDECPLTAASLTGCAWQYSAYTSWYDTWANNTLLNDLKQYFKRNVERFRKVSGTGGWPEMDVDQILKTKTLRNFNRLFAMPFQAEQLEDVDAFIERMSPVHYAHNINTTPLLSMHSIDDPICAPQSALKVRKQGRAGKRLVVAAYGAGGHATYPNWFEKKPVHERLLYGACHGDKLTHQFFLNCLAAKKKGLLK